MSTPTGVHEFFQTYSHLNLTGRVTKVQSPPFDGGASADVFKAILRGFPNENAATTNSEDGTSASDEHATQTVVLKRFRVYVSNLVAVQRNVIHEFEVWVKLRHDNVLQLLGYCTHEGMPAIVSPWMETGTILSFWKNNEGGPRQLTDIITDIGSGLEYLHKMDVIHCDLKCANILSTNTGIPLIADFGISRLPGWTTSTVNAKGTLRWMARELVVGLPPESIDTTTSVAPVNGTESQDPALVPAYTKMSDIWSFGMTLLELWTKIHPYKEIVDSAVALTLGKGTLPKSPLEPKDASVEHRVLWALCLRCWQMNPRDRPTIISIVEALQYFVKNKALSTVVEYVDKLLVQCIPDATHLPMQPRESTQFDRPSAELFSDNTSPEPLHNDDTKPSQGDSNHSTQPHSGTVANRSLEPVQVSGEATKDLEERSVSRSNKPNLDGESSDPPSQLTPPLTGYSDGPTSIPHRPGVSFNIQGPVVINNTYNFSNGEPRETVVAIGGLTQSVSSSTGTDTQSPPHGDVSGTQVKSEKGNADSSVVTNETRTVRSEVSKDTFISTDLLGVTSGHEGPWHYSRSDGSREQNCGAESADHVSEDATSERSENPSTSPPASKDEVKPTDNVQVEPKESSNSPGVTDVATVPVTPSPVKATRTQVGGGGVVDAAATPRTDNTVDPTSKVRPTPKQTPQHNNGRTTASDVPDQGSNVPSDHKPRSFCGWVLCILTCGCIR